MISESKDTVTAQEARADRDGEHISLRLALGILVALAAVFLVGGLIIRSQYFSVPTPRSALERELVLYRSRLSKNPNDAFARVSLAGVYFRLDQTDDAIAELKAARKLEPKLWEAPFQLGLIYLDKDQTALAVKYLELAKDADPQNELSYHQLGLVYMEANKNKLAIENLKHAVRLNPTAADAHYSLGLAYEKSNRRDEATLHFEEALRYVPDLADAKKALARLSNEK